MVEELLFDQGLLPEAKGLHGNSISKVKRKFIMAFLLTLIGIIEIIGGVLTWAVSKSAVHEILAALLVNFGFMLIGLGGVVEAIHKYGKKIAAPSTKAPLVDLDELERRLTQVA